MGNLLRPSIAIAGTKWPTYDLCLLFGIVFGLAAALVVTAHRGLSIAIMGACLVTALLALLVLVALNRYIPAQLYHYQFVTFAAVASVALVFHEHPLEYLDGASVTLSLCQAIGRIG